MTGDTLSCIASLDAAIADAKACRERAKASRAPAVEPLIPTADGFWERMALSRAKANGYDGPILTGADAVAAMEGFKAAPPKKTRKTPDGSGRKRWRCDVDGVGRSEDHVGNGRLCNDHPEAKSHAWRMGGGMAEAERLIRQWIDSWAMTSRLVEVAIEHFDPAGGWQTTQGEVAMCWALFQGWGGLPKDGGQF